MITRSRDKYKLNKMAGSGEEGRVALVTGSTSGIGLAIAKALAPKVQGLLIHGLGTEEQIKAAIECVRKAGTGSLRVEFHGANLTKPEEIREMVEFCKEKFGKTPDILINNAGDLLFSGMYKQ